jgi:hypothetical protein
LAQIPDSLPLAEVSGARPSTAVAGPTDFGLTQAGSTLEGVAGMDKRADELAIRAQAKLDRQAAEPALLALQNANEDAFAADAAAYNGEPGFAADQIAKAKARAAAAVGNPDLAPGVKAELTQMAQNETTRIGQAAITHEAKVRAQPIADQRAAQDQVQLNGGLTTFFSAYAPAKQTLLDNYDGSTHGLAGDVAAAFDQAAAAAVSATPPQLQGKLQAHLAALRTEEYAQAAVTEARRADAYVLKNSQDQAYSLINTISSNPLAYDTVVTTGLPAIVEALPKGLKKDALVEFTGQAAVARVKGLVDQGNANQAAAELNAGRYDAFLKPPVKEELLAQVDAAQRSHGPKSFDEWMAARDLEDRANAETYARMTTGRSTGQVSLDELAAKLSPSRAAEIATQWQAADKAYAVAGAAHDMPAGQLQAAAAAAPPDPAEPDYATKVAAWQTGQQAAAAELKARQNPGAWAYTIAPKPKGAAAAGAGQAQDRGAVLQQTWTDYLAAVPGDARAHQGGLLASRSLGVQAAAGIPAAAWQLVPQAQAAQLASTVVNAAPEQKLAALSSLAHLIHDLPAAFTMPDGSTAAPRAILARQLLAAHMTPGEVAAMADFVDQDGNPDNARLGRYVAALNDPTLKTPLPGGQAANLKAEVTAALKPFLDTAAPQAGEIGLAQARIDRTMLVARSLMAHQGINPAAAARTAAQDLTAGYRFVDTWRMPLAAAQGTVVDLTGLHDNAHLAQVGAGKLLAGLLANDGANLYAAAGQGGPDSRRKAYAQQVSGAGRWVTTGDETGLALAVPKPDGTWQQVTDRYGRPVGASWQQLSAYAQDRAPPPFATPPPNAVRGPDGAPVAAVSKAAAFSALAWAVNGRESHFRGGQVSAAGALGQMQVTPDTVRTYAPRLGLPVDLDRAKNDDAYNRQVGEAALQDNLQHFGATGPGIGLALAAYNAGPGRLDGYRDPQTNQWRPGWLQTIGDPRTGKISLTDFVNRIPVKETREYVQAVMPTAFARLQAGR